MKKTFHIQWTKVDPSNLDQHHYAQFFVLVRNGNPVYIGDSFRRSIKHLIPATMKAAALNQSSTEVYLGRVVEFVGLANDDVIEMHKLLVYSRKPIYNVIGKHDYKPVESICVNNLGENILPHTIKANQYGVFLSQKLSATVFAVA